MNFQRCLTQTNKCITISAEVTDVCFWVVIKNVKNHPNYPGRGLLVTGLLISARENGGERRNAVNEKQWVVAALRLRGALMYN